MAYESIKVDIIPGAENAEVLHFSQYDNKRPFFIELFNGADEFIPEAGMTITLECRKRDGNIVIISDPVLNDNVAEFSTTEQLTACYGDNVAEIKIVDENDLVIGSANFIINVEKSPTCGGLVSESEIDNLTQQIEDIAQEVIGDDYYNKTQTDALLVQKADIEDLPDMSRYYNKYEINNLLSNYVETSYLTTNYYTRSDSRLIFVSKDELQIAMQLEGQASGSIATFETAAPAQRLAALKCNFLCSGGNGTPSTPIPLVPFTEINVTNCGINLFALNDSPYQSAVNTGVSVNSESTDSLSITSSAVAYACRQLYYKLPAGTYTISVGETTKTGTDNPVISIYDYPNGSLIVNAISANNSAIFTLSDETVLDVRLFATGNTAEVNTVTFNNVQIEVGSTATAYNSYNANTITIDLDGTRYGGYVDANNGKLVVTHGCYTITGNETWLRQGANIDKYYTQEYILSDVAKLPTNNDNAVTIVTSIGTFNTPYNVLENYPDTMNLAADGRLTINASLYAGSGTLAGTQVMYELAAPILIDIYTEYLDTHQGVNNVFHDGNGTTEVSYKDTIQHYIDSRV